MSDDKTKKFDLNTLIQDADEKAWVEQLESTVGGDFAPAPEGLALARITGYVDLGKHKNSKGKLKDQAMLTLALFDPDQEKPKGYTNEKEGDDGEKVITGTPLTVNLPAKSANSKSHMHKMFNKIAKALELDVEDGIITPSQFLGKDIAVQVVHNVVKGENGQKDKTYANIRDADGEMTIRAPYFLDREGAVDKDSPMNVPKNAHVDYKIFLWEAPIKSHWMSLFIDGEREVTGEDGKTKSVSKNWIQEKIRSAENFSDSPLEAMLSAQGSSSKQLPKAKDNKVEEKREEEPEEQDEESTSDSASTGDKDALASEIESLNAAVEALKSSGMEEQTKGMQKELDEKKAKLEKLNG